MTAAEARGIPPMPEGFTDRAAWDAIHWTFGTSSFLDAAVIGWQRMNQDRVRAAAEASDSQSAGLPQDG
jgi:hypothetical protein